MSSSGFDSNAPSDAEMAALRSTMASVSLSSVGDSHPRDTPERARAASSAEMAALRSMMASVSLRSVGDSNPRDTSGRARAGLLTLPPELRLRIYKMLIQPRGTVDVGTLYAVRTAGTLQVLKGFRHRFALVKFVQHGADTSTRLSYQHSFARYRCTSSRPLDLKPGCA